jgi:hypothetical protein
MKHYCILAAVLILSIAACNNTTSTDEASSDSTPKTIEGLYDFAETKDPAFCNSDSLIMGDCNSGNLYFTAKGNVVYTFYCCCLDTDYYDLGKYTISGDSITCTFSKQYSFFNGFTDDAEAAPYDVNKGRLEEIKPWTIRLNKRSCGAYEYSFVSEGKYKSVVYKSGEESSKLFFGVYEKVKVFEGL